MTEVLATASKIARNAPLSIPQAKCSMIFGQRMDLRSAMFFEIDAYNQLVGTEDRREGIAAFNEETRAGIQGTIARRSSHRQRGQPQVPVKCTSLRVLRSTVTKSSGVFAFSPSLAG